LNLSNEINLIILHKSEQVKSVLVKLWHLWDVSNCVWCWWKQLVATIFLISYCGLKVSVILAHVDSESLW